jgi:hypothetical protein
MVRLVGGMCQRPGGCDTHPTFGMPGGKAVRCAAHKAPDMVATYGMKRDTPAKKKRRRDPEPSIPLLDAAAEEFDVHSIGDVKIAADPSSTARRKTPCLHFLVRWGPPFDDPSHDSWEPLRALSELDAMRTFLSTPTWATFVASAEYTSLSNKFKVPMN